MRVEIDESARFIRGRVSVSYLEILSQLEISVLDIWPIVTDGTQYNPDSLMVKTGHGTLTRPRQLFQK